MSRYFFLFIILFPGWVVGQILDDSTQSIYGPETTLYYLEEDLKLNRSIARPIDTVLTGHQRFGYVQENDFKFQNLGNIGTALTPIFPQRPDLIGARSGFDSYNYVFDDASRIKYYDTKSPFLEAELDLGGNGRSILDVEYARNVNPQWNVGFEVTLYRIDKQVGEEQTRGDRNAESDNWYFFTSYHTKDSSYHALLAYSRMNHQVNETGGVLFNPEEDEFEAYFDSDADINLRNTISRDARNQIHLYHQYQFSRYVQLYHVLDNQRQSNFFTGLSASDDIQFLGDPLIDSDTTFNKTKLRSFENELGIKGDIGKIFYRVYYRRRDVKFVYQFLPLVGPFTENYAGTNLRINWSDDLSAEVSGEYLSDGFYDLKFSARYKWITASFQDTRVRPAFISEAFFGNYDEWMNDFTSQTYQTIRLKVDYPVNQNISVAPKAEYTEIARPVFWNAAAEPEQSTNSAFLFTGGLETRLRFLRNMHFNGEVLYTTVSGQAGDVYRIPEIFYQGTLFYRNRIFKKRLLFELGVDTHWKSAYFANDYDPVMQQFFLQNRQEIPAYLLIDLFLNFKVNRTCITMKINQFSQGLIDPGYLVTPDYIGTPSTFDLLISWPFFD
jgi:hypothetical protein